MKPLLTLLPLLLLAGPLLAQGNKPPPRTARLLYLRAPSGAPGTLHLFDGVTSRQVDLPRMNFSKSYPLPPGTLNLRLLSKAVADPKLVPPAAPAATLPAGVADCYLLLSADPQNPVAPVRIDLVDASAATFRKGQVLWFNLTDHPVAGTVGGRALRLGPKGRALLDPPANGKESYPVDLAYKIPGDARSFPLCETKWLHDPRSKLVAFVFAEPGRRAPRVLAFPDFRPPPEKKR